VCVCKSLCVCVCVCVCVVCVCMCVLEAETYQPTQSVESARTRIDCAWLHAHGTARMLAFISLPLLPAPLSLESLSWLDPLPVEAPAKSQIRSEE